ncbi:hypothetical protein [Enterococcus gallinarum]|uniref:Uncharacterized protein n=1 Tax=Enterococcus gallinarum TaxID=1353 RepID=A0ABD4ZWY7_ENTGA|nr:hypothetical protein [Enterococcus gallinarum]MBF0726515.1 hypothetical protein [Enterococcus gallinarum]MBX8979357.1 hypothetical protein [Enterococcus gallinarum]MCR1932102.1 hypothetical protein [Enterococcus gallinarum]MDL4876613.1 hypothetical protein [Enterococcus gallinarum]MDL4883057.1 hypothetical protein [Enterococcus gallinarum]
MKKQDNQSERALREEVIFDAIESNAQAQIGLAGYVIAKNVYDGQHRLFYREVAETFPAFPLTEKQ